MERDCLIELRRTLEGLRILKTQAATSETARAIAVTITELEKVYAYFKTFVVEVVGNGSDREST